MALQSLATQPAEFNRTAVIGGYQVMKKWLSYREHSFLKRPLTLAEAEEVQAMARRLTGLCLLQPQLDANYEAVKTSTWKRETAEATLTGAGA